MNELQEQAFILQCSAMYLKLKYHEQNLAEILKEMEDNL